jgi:RNA polymerase sigma-70 factor (ECF subfamily)
MIWDALERIEEGDREVIALVDIKGLSYENASLLLGIPVNTLRSRLFRAREKLRLELEREEFF